MTSIRADRAGDGIRRGNRWRWPVRPAAAIRLKQFAAENDREISVCILEKGGEIGAQYPVRRGDRPDRTQ